MTISEYIDYYLPKTIRDNKEDKGELIGLPYPYIVPCAFDGFQEMYYWDTYFTHKGLLVRKEYEQIRYDIDNMCYLIDRYGFMPNGNKTNFLYDSQPPFLSMMMRDYYDVTGDRAWLAGAYSALKKEHAFWEKNRRSGIGLGHYDCQTLPEEMVHFSAQVFRERTGLCMEEPDEMAARAMISAGESGWDMNPRMAGVTYQFAPVDLNSLLYAMEDHLSYFAEELGRKDEAAEWKIRKQNRQRLCRRYLKNAEGHFMDYNFVTDRQSTIFSAASFYPLYCGMANQEEAQAAKEALPHLETEYGVLTCEKNDATGNYQWDYPNGWAPLQLIVIGGLLRYGYQADALRIAGKFKATVERCYADTGHLWEKYNMADGSVKVQNEYEMPPMLGWTFGVYEWILDLLREEA